MSHDVNPSTESSESNLDFGQRKDFGVSRRALLGSAAVTAGGAAALGWSAGDCSTIRPRRQCLSDDTVPFFGEHQAGIETAQQTVRWPDDAKKAQTWHRQARVVAAYRDRYKITDDDPIGATPDNTAQKIDAARARTALNRAKELARKQPVTEQQRPVAPVNRGYAVTIGA